MPQLTIETNAAQPAPEVWQAQAKELTQLVSKALGKPVEYVTVGLHFERCLMWGGAPDDACAHCRLTSLGGINKAANAAFSKTLADFLLKNYGVEPNRYYLLFVDPKRSDMGWNGATF